MDRFKFIIVLALLSWVGLLGYTSIVAVTGGGTGASTAAGARTNIIYSGASTISCSSPCTPGASVTTITVSGTTTVNLPALSGYSDGQALLVHCDSASACLVTLDPSDSGTCDGGSAGAACSVITVPAHGATGARRLSSSAWGSTVFGAMNAVSSASAPTVNDDSGDGYAVGQQWIESTNKIGYLLTDATAGAAVWRPLLSGTRALKIALEGGSLCWREMALTGGGTWVSVSTSCTALTVETGGNTEVTFSGTTATAQTTLGTGGGTACQSAPYEAYVALSSLSSYAQGLLTTGAPVRLEVKLASLNTGVTTSQMGAVLTGGRSGGLDTSAECFMELAIRQGVSTHTGRSTPNWGNAANLGAAPKVVWAGWQGYGVSDSDGCFVGNASGGPTTPTTTGATWAVAGTDRLYINWTAVTSSPSVTVSYSDPQVWLILGVAS